MLKGMDGNMGESRQELVTLVSIVKEHALTQPDKEALIFKKETLTYRELDERITAAGELLAKMGIKKGDRVLFTALSRPDMAFVYLGIQYAGGIVVFMDRNATPENALSIYEDTQASLFLTDRPMKGYEDQVSLYSLKKFVAQVEERVSAGGLSDTYSMPDPEDVAEMIFTTGTTGRPKGVMLSYRALHRIWLNNIEGVGITKEDRMLLPLPLCHSLGLRMLRMTLYLGGTVVLQNGFTFAKELENNIRSFGCTAMVTVPASFELVKNQMQESFTPVIGLLRSIEVGAGSLSLRQKKEFDALLPDTRITNTWGSSETGGAIFLNLHEAAAVSRNALETGDSGPDPEKPLTERVTSIGKPLPGVQVRALDPDGKPLDHTDRDHPGRLALNGPFVMSGYWNRPEQTADALRDGWLVTNDLVYFDRDGFVYMLGRADDIINVGGEKVSPIEVENLASEYSHIKECACIAAPDEVLGQVPVLLMAVDETYEQDGLEGLKTYLSRKMERFKLPADYMIVDELPRNRMKKPDRKEMKRLWKEAHPDTGKNDLH